MKKIFIMAAMLMLLIVSTAAAETIEITDSRATAKYWTNRNANGDDVIITPQQIATLNAQMLSKDMYSADLANYPQVISADKLNALIKEAEYDAFNSAHLVNSDVQVRYAVTVQRGNIRLLPQGLTGDPYDELQGTAIDPAEAVAVFQDSVDGKFVFVQSRNYIGWLDKSVLAFTDRQTWLTYANPQNFLVVTAHKKIIDIKGQNILFQMGATIPLKSNKLTPNNYWITRFPISVNGQLQEVDAYVWNDETLNKGFLPCTTNNFIRQAFRFLGDVYGWGGLDDSVDCSSFTSDIYRSMGINIPRDADRQEGVMPIVSVFNDVTTAERFDIVSRAPVGALLFKPGHVMMNLGVDRDGTPIAIHAASSYYAGGNKIYIRKVIVSDLRYKNAAGVETIDGLTGISFVK